MDRIDKFLSNEDSKQTEPQKTKKRVFLNPETNKTVSVGAKKKTQKSQKTSNKSKKNNLAIINDNLFDVGEVGKDSKRHLFGWCWRNWQKHHCT